jgi:hypothetical protein
MVYHIFQPALAETVQLGSLDTQQLTGFILTQTTLVKGLRNILNKL